MCNESLAADKATPCEKLFELANSSQLVIARIVAANASISSDVVAALQLRKDPKINRALAANPAIPMAILEKLGVRYTSEFVHNPIFKMEQISDPLFLTHLPSRLLKKILTHESTPESILLWACEHRDDFDFDEDDTVEEWLISSPRSMLVVCSELSAKIRLEIAQRKHLSQEMVCALAADEDVNVRRTIAGKHDLSEPVLRQLFNHLDAGIRHHFAQREHLPQEMVCALAADDDVNVRRAVTRRHDLSTTVVKQLSNDSDAGIRKQIAQRARLSQEIVCALAADQDVLVRRAVAGRHDLSEAAVRQLSNDEDEPVRKVFLRRILSWAIVLAEKPDESIITNSDFRDRIIATGLPWSVRDIRTNIEMLLIPTGRFMMGAIPDAPHADDHANDDEKPAHEVLISNAFYLGRTPVTQGQWQAKMGSNPSYFQPPTYTLDTNRPVEAVSWDMIQEFNTVTGLRLPTEAEWEYACRAGSSTPRYGVLSDIAWHADNSYRATHAVATKLPNELGLYDMLGNVWEWCADWYGAYSSGSVTNPTGPMTGSSRLARGGWDSDSNDCRASKRYRRAPHIAPKSIGFRVAKNP